MIEQPEPTFEEALGQLERIVADLERGGPDLTAALGRYESGIRLLKRCHVLLDQAEQSVALLTGVDAEGNPITAPFDGTATIARETVAATISTSTTVVVETVETNEVQAASVAKDPTTASPARKPARRPKAAEPELDPDLLDPPF